MLSLKDLLDYCDLDCSEIEAIAEHEHIPLVLAAEMSSSLLNSPEGICNLHRMMLENIEHALEHGELQHATELSTAYQHLSQTHTLPLYPR
ncbi:MAG: hypothetical protein RIR00_1232 [Pseudomonadota bacterium]